MLPLIGGAVGFLVSTVNAVGMGATAGMSYGMGRKYGRKICEFADGMEGRLVNMMQNRTE